MTFHQVEFPKSWVIKSKQAGRMRAHIQILKAHGHLLPLWKQDQEGWGST